MGKNNYWYFFAFVNLEVLLNLTACYVCCLLSLFSFLFLEDFNSLTLIVICGLAYLCSALCTRAHCVVRDEQPGFLCVRPWVLFHGIRGIVVVSLIFFHGSRTFSVGPHHPVPILCPPSVCFTRCGWSCHRNLIYESYGLLITLVTMVAGLAFVVTLSVFHCFLVVTNQTTKVLSDREKEHHKILRSHPLLLCVWIWGVPSSNAS